jgi:archaellum component FlaG (FlaF/FlaG flagellin family)
VALTTGVDGTVSLTLVDGNVTYVANTASASATNSYAVDPGATFSGKLMISSDLAGTQRLGSIQVNWN